MRVVHVASEVAPFAQSGGLADVVAGLPAALAEPHGLDVAVVVPLYRGVEARLAQAGCTLDAGEAITIVTGWHHFQARMRTTKIGRVTYAFVDCAPLYDRDGTLYGPGGADEFMDNHVRFAALGKAVVDHAATILGAPPDVLHVHDWQGGPAAIYARLAQAPYAIVATIHNLAYRGIFPKQVMPELGLPWSSFTLHDLEFYDQVSFLKGGLAAADAVTTVSPSYASEIVTPQFGEALDSFLQWDVRQLVGIVNGIDARAWDPATDPTLPARYRSDDLVGKAACRREVARELGLSFADDDVIIAVIARMTGQKGLDLVADIVPELARLGAKLVVLGSGEYDLEQRFRWLGDVFREQIAVRIGFDLAMSRRLYAASDLFVMPSRFEPCGLGQLYAMRYGSIPVVHAVGGLRDTVDDITGVSFQPASTAALLAALEHAIAIVRNPRRHHAMQRAGMTRDSSWSASAAQYLGLYKSVRK
jgi:starch synthase